MLDIRKEISEEMIERVILNVLSIGKDVCALCWRTKTKNRNIFEAAFGAIPNLNTAIKKVLRKSV